MEWILLNQTLASKPASPLSQENWENKPESQANELMSMYSNNHTIVISLQLKTKKALGSNSGSQFIHYHHHHLPSFKCQMVNEDLCIFSPITTLQGWYWGPYMTKKEITKVKQTAYTQNSSKWQI